MRTNSSIVLMALACLLVAGLAQDGFNQQYKPVENSGDNNSQQQSNAGYVKSNFSPIDAELQDIVWCGEKKNVIFILSESGTLYRSVDDGFTGHVLTDHMERIGQREIIGQGTEVGYVTRIIPSPNDKSTFIFLGSEGINWVTKDCGGTIKAMNQGRKVEDFHFHPTEKDWLLASAWTLCEDFIDEPCRRYKELFYSHNLGEDWIMLADYVYEFSWGMADQFAARIPKERIIIAHEPHAKGHQKTGGWNHRMMVSYSDSFFNSSKVLVQGGNKFLLSKNFLFVVRVVDPMGQEVELLVGNSLDPHYKHLKKTELPHKHLFEHSYTILDTSEHAIFLHINHEGENSRYGNIYVSDSTGHRFNLALQGNVREMTGQCDFERVQGLDGIYLANVYDMNQMKKHKQMEEVYDEQIPMQHDGFKKTTNVDFNGSPLNNYDYGVMAAQRSIDDFKKTMITFDKGGYWTYLTPPTHDSQGKRVLCRDVDCALHLHSISSYRFGPFYTTENSIGIIIGTGNVGDYLSNDPEDINTYMSRDGGLTWYEIGKGSHIYEIGDHGSILVMANDQTSVTHVQYSWDEGLTWNSVKISDTPVHVRNIITEPSNTAEKFVIYGHIAEDERDTGFVVALDFTTLHQRWCNNPQNPDTPDSDYETWTPSGKVSQNCLLGRDVHYIRKKREAQCFSKEDHEAWKFIKHCECTEENWECDFGYYRKDNKGGCVPSVSNSTEDLFTPPEQCHGHYEVTQGYRKVAGDSCKGGVDHSPLKVPCPGVGSINFNNFVVILVLVGIVLSLIWLSNKGNTERFKDIFAEIVNTVIGLFKRGSSSGDQPGGPGWVPLSGDVNSKESNVQFDNIFEDSEEDTAQEVEDSDLLDQEEQGKRKTKKNALEAAQTKVPALHKPGEKKDKEMSLLNP